MGLPAFTSPVPFQLPLVRTTSRSKRPKHHVWASAVRSPTLPKADTKNVDVVVIGSGIGALTAAADLASKGASVCVLEKYCIPGGSSGYFVRDGYMFDAGASMIFGFGERGTTNLLTRALGTVGRRLDTIPDPVQVRYHLPGINIRVHREYEHFLEELIKRFPSEENGIRKFYGECWNVFNALNAMPLRSLEEPNYLLRVFFAHPFACLSLLRYIARNTGDIARKHITDKELLRFIDMECYSWSVVPADLTPMINAGMVFSDRHYGGINYPVGGVGRISQELVQGIESNPGCTVQYSSRVTKVLFAEGRACGVRLADGSEINAKAVISNATRWDTFGERGLVDAEHVPTAEYRFRERYLKSPSFCSMHIAVREADLGVSMHEKDGMDCHHIMLDDWNELETAREGKGTLFVSIPTVLDKSLAPEGMHIFHVFTPSWMDEWDGLSVHDYKLKKQRMLETVTERLERTLFPGLKGAIDFAEVGSPKTHRRFLGRIDGSYGPVAKKKLRGLLSMPFNRTELDGLYCVGDSTFPGQGLNATAFSGFACGHRVAADLGLIDKLPGPLDSFLTNLLSKQRLKL
ncbi:Carotene isomerase [Gracilaria domingensis]|nr:Carotene isomerase [Gracilaria domingensis]